MRRPPSLAVAFGRPIPRYLREGIRLFGFGAAEQALLSFSSLLYVVFLSQVLTGAELGRYSLVWSIVLFSEAVIVGFFGDGIPAIANRIPKRNWPQFRTSVYMGSAASLLAAWLLVSTALLALTFLAPSAAAIGWQAFLPTICGAIAIRMHQTFRRLAYLDEARELAAGAAVAFAIALLASAAATYAIGLMSSTSAILCWAFALAIASLAALFRRNAYDLPDRRFLGWFAHRTWRSGIWLSASSVMHWSVGFGLVPSAALLFGLGAAGAVRLLFALIAPLQQVVAVLHTILLPRMAAMFRMGLAYSEIRGSIVRSTAGFAGVCLVYAIALMVASPVFVPVLFANSTVIPSVLTLALMLAATTAEALRTALSIPLVATSRTAPITLSWATGLVALAIGIFAASMFGHLDALVTCYLLAQILALSVLALALHQDIKGNRGAQRPRPIHRKDAP